MGTLCIVGGVTGYARTRSIPSIVAGIRYVLPQNQDSHQPYPPGPRITCSVGALYLYSGDCIRKHTANGLETALGACDCALCLPPSQGAQHQMVSPRCFRAIIPILSPEIFQGPDPRDAYRHLSRNRRILRQGYI
jgi:uncharacterized membrane protein (UPF0136 family)